MRSSGNFYCLSNLARSARTIIFRHMKNKPELLAPAGDFVCLRAALEAGCDAVYFGLSNLNMRAAAANFGVDNLPEIAEICNNYGVRRYVTLNTILLENELLQARKMVEACKGHVDAIICWDPAVIQICRELGVSFHISTQASVANSAAAKFYRDLGAERIVLARECSLQDVEDIRKSSGIEAEVFVHGAMCVSISGRCFLSQYVHGKSGNRGACYQNCRREYEIVDDTGENRFRLGSNYILSAQDLCTLPFLEKILASGAESLKIEGRNRSPEYVKVIVECYRKAIDAWMQNELTAELKDELVTRARTVFNRKFSSGFYFGKPMDAYTESGGSCATEKKKFVGQVENYYSKIGVMSLIVQDSSFSTGDRLMIQGPSTGVLFTEVSEIRQNNKPVPEAERGVVSVPFPQKVRKNDRVFVLYPA